MSSARDQVFWKESSWELLPVPLRLALVLGLVSIQASIIMLADQERCFAKFGLMSSVQKDLGGNPLAVVRPFGWVAISLTLVTALALGAFYAWMSLHLSSGA